MLLNETDLFSIIYSQWNKIYENKANDSIINSKDGKIEGERERKRAKGKIQNNRMFVFTHKAIETYKHNLCFALVFFLFFWIIFIMRLLITIVFVFSLNCVFDFERVQ